MSTPTQTPELAGTYDIDAAHSRIGFVARHAMVTKVRGHFEDVAGTAVIDTQDPSASSVDLTIQVASIATGNGDRDGHLRSADFFDTDAHPTIRFVSTDVAREGEEWTITGDLTIKSVTRPVTVVFTEGGAATDPFGNQRVGFEGSVAVNRKDWDLTWNAALETGGVLVSEKVTLELDVSAIRRG